MPGEFCDDGDTSALNKCSANCMSNVAGWSCTGGNITNPSTCVEVCGDNVLTASEGCDDFNIANLDGCSLTC